MKLRKKTLVNAISAVCGTLLVSPGYVIAEEVPDNVLEEIIVTATRRDQNLQDIPYNISALTGASIEATGVADMSDLMRLVPGVTYFEKGPRSGINNANLVLRGINAESGTRIWTPFPTAPAVSTYVNETPIFVNLRLKDIERVEVLRGPQGTLYGSGSLAGTVRFLYNKPNLDQFSLYVSAGLGQYENGDGVNYEGDVVINIPFSDTLALRAAAGYVDKAGFVDNTNLYVLREDGTPELDNGSTDPIGDAANFYAGQPVYTSDEGSNGARTKSFRTALRWMPNDKFDTTVSFHYQDDESDSAPFVAATTLGQDTFESLSLILEPAEREVSILSLETQYDMGFATLSGSVSGYEHNGSATADQTAFLENFGFFPIFYGTSPRNLIEDITEFEEDGTIVEVRLASNTDGMFDWVVGLFYQDQEYHSSELSFAKGYDDYANSCFITTGTFGGPPCGFGTFYGIVPGVVKDNNFVLIQDNEFKDKAAFGELTWHMTERWQITGGFRYYDQEFSTITEQGLPFVSPGTETVAAGSEETGSVFKLNTSYDLNDTTMLYALWSEGFRRGGANGLPSSVFGVPTSSILDVYEPDETTNREVGLKGSLQGGRYNYTLTYFNMDWSNIQANSACTPLALACVINAGEANSEGVELSVQGQPTDNLAVNIGYTYQNARLDTVNPDIAELVATGNVTFNVEEGAELPGTPKHSLFLGGLYTQPLANGWQLVYGLNGSFRDNAESDISVISVTVDSFWMWNASLSLQADKWSVTAFIRNIGDDRGITATQNPDVFGPRGRSNASLPRAIGLRFDYLFSQD